MSSQSYQSLLHGALRLLIITVIAVHNFHHRHLSSASRVVTAEKPELREAHKKSVLTDKEIEYHTVGGLSSYESSTTPYDTQLENDVSKVLDTLVASHDRRIRPNYGGPPTEVNVTIHVITISAVSEVSMDFTVDLYLRQFWQDSRLSFKSVGLHSGEEAERNDSSFTVGIDMVKSIWIPDTFFPNEKRSFFHETTTHNSFLRIDNYGNVLRSIRLTVTANCPMSLHTFPLDVQLCPLEIESYGYSTDDIVYHWHSSSAVTIDENVHLAHFSIGDHYHVERVISLSTGNYSRLTSYFTFSRNIGFYLIQIYFPSSLIVVISWVSFFLSREATQARVTIGVTTVLTQTTLMTSTNASLPKVSYVKSIDIFLGVCFFIVFASLLEYAMVGLLMRRERYLPYQPAKSSTLVGNMCYYELDVDQQQPTAQRSASVRIVNPQLRTPDVKASTPTSTSTQKRNRFSTQNRQNNGASEQVIPLLNLSPSTHRLNVLSPEPSILDSGQRSQFRPSRVDLISRIAFPLFFVLFHFAYWTVYLNLR